MSIATVSAEAAPAACLSEANYTYLQRLIRQESGIIVEADKRYLLDARLLPIVREENLRSLDELSERLATRPDPSLRNRVVDAMTTNETLFFRDRSFFEALRTVVLPGMFGRANGRKARIWSSAASTGQEAYSLAMLLLEQGRRSTEVEIVGTDISGQALERAREGKYVQFEVNRGLPAPMLMRYFTKQGMDWIVNPEVRALTSFRQFDLVLCRNVLIYFDGETKRTILGNLADALEVDGLLALGGTELVMDVPRGLERSVVERATFYQRKGVSNG